MICYVPSTRFNLFWRTFDDLFSGSRQNEHFVGHLIIYEVTVARFYLFWGQLIESDGQLRTSLYDKRDDFNFHITNFPFLSSNIPSSPAYGVFISQLIRYARACSSYENFILRAARLSSKLLRQGYVMERLKSSLRKFYGRYGDLIKHYCEFITELGFNTDFDLITEFLRFP